MLGKRNKARAKAESKELFKTMLKFKHTTATPKKYKGTRSENKRKALDNEQ